MDAMRVVMKNRRRNEADSWKNIIPRMTVHTAPMPVHIGYAVPIGMVFTALASSTMLIVRHKMKPVPQSHHAVPETSFIFPRQNAKPDSNSPATIRIIHLDRLPKEVVRKIINFREIS